MLADSSCARCVLPLTSVIAAVLCLTDAATWRSA